MNAWHTHSERRRRSSVGSPSGRFSDLSPRVLCLQFVYFAACSSRPTRCGRWWRVEPLQWIILRARSR